MTTVRYCSACGAGLPVAPPVTCAACGTSHWSNPKPCANAVIVERQRVLLTQRAHSPWKGAWCSPGGFCERGEHPIETVVREALEETGFRIRVTGYLGVWVDDYVDGPDHRENEVINVAYYLAETMGEARGDVDRSEVSDLGWFGWDELPSPLAPPGTLAAVLQAARNAGSTPLLDRPQ
ncbi:MAG: NUDIX hydrolase [Actinobacteria bacterium]|nr:NUDIX hydrolase [Actinomycetota bacterium]